jgi:hypothetical protein
MLNTCELVFMNMDPAFAGMTLVCLTPVAACPDFCSYYKSRPKFLYHRGLYRKTASRFSGGLKRFGPAIELSFASAQRLACRHLQESPGRSFLTRHHFSIKPATIPAALFMNETLLFSRSWPIFAGIIKGATGIGYSSCALPFLAAALDAKTAIVLLRLP